MILVLLAHLNVGVARKAKIPMIIHPAITDADLALVCRVALFVPVIVEIVVNQDALIAVEAVLTVVQVVIILVQVVKIVAAEDVQELALLLVLNIVQGLALRDVLAIVIMGVQVKKLIN